MRKVLSGKTHRAKEIDDGGFLLIADSKNHVRPAVNCKEKTEFKDGLAVVPALFRTIMEVSSSDNGKEEFDEKSCCDAQQAKGNKTKVKIFFALDPHSEKIPKNKKL
ncbi:MAG: hypothetical protein IJS52_07035 [Bacilli bacterium]|nr:hypothetical protein [Bacilli bacterium]